MHIYLSTAPTHPLQVSHILDTIANLYRLRVLADSSRVWAQVGSFDNKVWALTDRSACIQYLQTNKPGCARITQERLRWAPTTDGSQENPQLEILYDTLPSDKAQSLTLVVDHCDTNDHTVNIIEKSSKRENSDGTYKSEETGVHVIDASAYRGNNLIWKTPDGEETYTHTPGASSLYPNVSEYESAHATVYGVEFMTQNMTKAEAQKVRKNPERYRLQLGHKALDTIVNYSFTNMAQLSAEIINDFSKR